MESLSCGVPVLAYKIGGIPDMITHFTNGYLADSVSADSLTKGIEWMCMNKEYWVKLSMNAREGIIKKNSPEVIGNSYLQLYKKVML